MNLLLEHNLLIFFLLLLNNPCKILLLLSLKKILEISYHFLTLLHQLLQKVYHSLVFSLSPSEIIYLEHEYNPELYINHYHFWLQSLEFHFYLAIFLRYCLKSLILSSLLLLVKIYEQNNIHNLLPIIARLLTLLLIVSKS